MLPRGIRGHCDAGSVAGSDRAGPAEVVGVGDVEIEVGADDHRVVAAYRAPHARRVEPQPRAHGPVVEPRFERHGERDVPTCALDDPEELPVGRSRLGRHREEVNQPGFAGRASKVVSSTIVSSMYLCIVSKWESLGWMA